MDKMPIKPNVNPALDDDAPIFDSGCLALIGKTLFTSVIVGLIAAFKFLGLAFLSIAIIFLPLRLLNVDTGFSLIIAAGVTLLMLKIMGWIRLIKWLLSDMRDSMAQLTWSSPNFCPPFNSTLAGVTES